MTDNFTGYGIPIQDIPYSKKLHWPGGPRLGHTACGLNFQSVTHHGNGRMSQTIRVVPGDGRGGGNSFYLFRFLRSNDRCKRCERKVRNWFGIFREV